MDSQIGRSSSQGTPRPRTAKTHVKEQLLQEILTGQLRGGKRLVQADLANRFGVSTTPVREALQELASEGVVRLDPHRGAVVSEFSKHDLMEIFELRRVLEPIVMRLALPEFGAAELETLRTLCRQMEATRDVARWVQLNREFHGMFMAAAGWPRLASIVGALQDSAAAFVAMAMQFRSEMFESGNRDHRLFVDAVVAGDVDALVNCTIDHMDITLDALRERFES